MPIGLPLTLAPLAGIILLLALAVVLTRLWAHDTTTQALRELNALGMQPGRKYKLGSTWALLAARDRRNVRWAALALVAWVALIVAVDVRLVTW